MHGKDKRDHKPREIRVAVVHREDAEDEAVEKFRLETRQLGKVIDTMPPASGKPWWTVMVIPFTSR